MKKILSATCAMMLASAGMMANAQQLPNVGFDTWQTCVEQKGTGGQTYSMNNSYVTRPGSEPFSWNGSSVNQMGIVSEELIKNQEGSALLFNKKVGFATLSSVAPGYITLGTPWVYATIPVKNSDGGTFGGVSFTYKPDAIKGRYKRTDNTGEASHIIAYLWNGEFNSKIANNEDCVDSDRAIFANNDPNGKLVASCDFTFTGTNNNEWQEIEVPLFYEKDAGDPTMMNVIISAGDYWNRGELKDGTTLLVDDVCFIYYSRLASISFKGIPFENLKENVYYYEVDAPLNFTKEDVVANAMGQTGAVTDITVDAEMAQVKVTVSNNVGSDSDGVSSHTYTFQYQKPEVEPIVEVYEGFLNVEMNGGQIEQNTQSKIEIHDYQNGTCTFLLPNLTIGGTLALGDIRIDNVVITSAEGGNSYTGTVEDMALLGGAIHAKVVLNGTISSDVKMDVDVIWYQDYPTNEEETPIKVSFTSAPLSSVDSVAGDGVKVYAAAGCVVVEGAEGVAQVYTADGKQVAAETVNGKTEIALANGLYIVRVGNKVQKVVVK